MAVLPVDELGSDADIRHVLGVERAGQVDRLRAMTTEFDEIVASAADANGDDEHDPEGSTVAFERARVAALLAAAQRRLDELDHAIGRLDDGTYRRCAHCGGGIDPERLAALPSVDACVACAGRPVRGAPTARR
jgi:RNA polymerase-binding transcription factor DksA